MGARLIQRGDTLDYVNGTAAVISAGKVIVAGTFVGVVQNDIPVGALGAIAITGVWAIEKGTDAFDVGAPVYFDSANGRGLCRARCESRGKRRRRCSRPARTGRGRGVCQRLRHLICNQSV